MIAIGWWLRIYAPIEVVVPRESHQGPGIPYTIMISSTTSGSPMVILVSW